MIDYHGRGAGASSQAPVPRQLGGNMTEINELYNAAEDLCMAGLAVIPLAENIKRPALAGWSEDQKRGAEAR